MIRTETIREPAEAIKLADLLLRYSGASADALKAVLCPLLLPIKSLDKRIVRTGGGKHPRGHFTVELTSEAEVVLAKGRTGKFVGANHVAGGIWREIAKGRITHVDEVRGVANGEIYLVGPASRLKQAMAELDESCLLEIDQFGASAKVLSGLAEYYLMLQAKEEGFAVRRMPEDMARHLGEYANYDFEFTRGRIKKKVEAKSLWGTNTAFARLIHSKSGGHVSSSCKFATQDIFAVSLFLRTGNIMDFAFARSVARSPTKPYGLPVSSKHPEYVNQNPPCQVGDGSWFKTIEEVWNLP